MRLRRDVSYGGITVPAGTEVTVVAPPDESGTMVIVHEGARVTVRVDAVEWSRWRRLAATVRERVRR